MPDNQQLSQSTTHSKNDPTEQEVDIWDGLEDDEITFEEPEQQTQTPENTTHAPTTEKKSQDSAKKGRQLQLIEKIALSALALLFVGLAASSYIWLYKKNDTTNPFAVTLPLQGQFVTINAFSTYWKSATKHDKTKPGAEVIPSVKFTLNKTNNSGALRFYFRNLKNETVGDPITLTIKNGAIQNPGEPNISISDDGLTATITSSDGFHQEGDFSAYVLDKHLAWSIQIFEADSADAKWEDFKEIASPKIEPLRK